MDVAAGLVGLPNVGKSTLFNTLTTAEAEADNYPFCTIDPNVGVLPVPDPRLHTIVDYFDTDEITPTTVEIRDIAGLVSGASEGEGLGNEFLTHIREVDALLHVVRCFEDDDVAHVEGSVDPARDVDIIETELILADLQTVERRLEKAEKGERQGDEESADRAAALRKAREALDAGEPARAVDFSEHERRLLRDSHLLSIKPVLFVANMGEDDLEEESAPLEELREIARERGSEVLTVCASLEAELGELDRDDQREMLQGLGIDEPVLDTLVRKSHELLGLKVFFTAGPKEVRAWTVPEEATAGEAAAAIHTDLQRHFIQAEVITVGDLLEYGSVDAIREAGAMQHRGEEYLVQDGDIIHFKHNA